MLDTFPLARILTVPVPSKFTHARQAYIGAEPVALSMFEIANFAATANWTNGSLNRPEQDGPAIPVDYRVGSVRILLSGGIEVVFDGDFVSVAIFR